MISASGIRFLWFHSSKAVKMLKFILFTSVWFKFATNTIILRAGDSAISAFGRNKHRSLLLTKDFSVGGVHFCLQSVIWLAWISWWDLLFCQLLLRGPFIEPRSHSSQTFTMELCFRMCLTNKLAYPKKLPISCGLPSEITVASLSKIRPECWHMMISISCTLLLEIVNVTLLLEEVFQVRVDVHVVD